MDFHVSAHVVGWIFILAPIMIILVPCLIWQFDNTVIFIFCLIAMILFVGSVTSVMLCIIQGLHILIPETFKVGPFWQ